MMTKRGQGTIEYLVIIAIVIVIALVVVGLLLQIMGQGSGIPQASAQAGWKSEQPWSIIDWSRTGTTLTVVLKNNSGETMDFSGMHLNSTDANSTGTSNVSSGVQITKAFTGLTACVSGTKYSYPKSGIYIDYNSSTLSGKKQVANDDIVGACS